MGNISHTVGSDSNLVSFRSAARVPITSLKASFLPKQDLHGYTKPWIGGSGKNKLGFTLGINLPNSSNRTIDFTNDYITINVQDAVTTNAIIDYNNMVSYCKTNLIPGTYTFSIQDFDTNISNISKSDIKIIFTHNIVVSDGETFTISENCTGLAVNYSSMINWNNGDYMQFHLQIEEGSSVTTWEPYENICPIEGWNNIEITHTGKNIFDAEHITHISVNAWVNSGGTHQITPSNADRTFYIPCRPNTNYTITKALGDVLAGGYTTVLPATGVETYDYHRSYTTPTKSITITTGADAKYLAIWYYDNSKTYDKTVEPISLARTIQIEENNESTTYEQFQKNQTISVTFPVLGKNKFNWNVEQSYSSPVSSDLNTLRSFTPNTYVIGMSVNNYYRHNYTTRVLNPSVSNGIISFSSGGASGYGIAFPLELIPGQTYFLSGTGNGSAGATYYDKDGKVISFQNARLNKTITVPQEAVLTLIGFYASATNTDYSFSNIQLELGTEATTYEEYNPDNTVYGGYIDIVTGEVVATYKYVVLTDSSKWSLNTSGNIKFFAYEEQMSDRLAGSGSKYNIMCSIAQSFAETSIPENPWHIQFNTSSQYYPTLLWNSVNYSEFSVTLDDIKTLTSNNQISICYPLATPIHYPLTPIQLTTFLNQNTIWSNTNSNTEVSYAIHDSAMIRATKQQILAAAQPQLLISSGSFQTNFPAPLQSAKIYFNPIQEGSGDPSPENVRPITGWTGLSVYHSGENLYIPNAENQGYINKSGVINVDTTSTYTDLIPVNPGETYSFRCTTVSVNGDTNRRIHGYDSNGDWVQQIVSGTTAPNTVEDRKILATIPSGIAYIRVSFRNQDTDVRIAKENVYEIDWENEVGTVYGGYVDLVTGTIVRDWLIDTHEIKATDGTPGGAGTGNNTNYRFVAWNLPSAHLSDSNRTSQAVCNIAPYNTRTGSTRFWLGGGTVYMVLPNDNQSYSVIVAYAERSLNISKYQLTPQQLKTLRGQNNIWSNANGHVEVKYWTH